MAQFGIGEEKFARVVWVRDDGTPGRVDGVPQWTNSNSGAVEMTVADDGMSARVRMLAEGTAQLIAVADADLGDGVRNVQAVGDIEVRGAEVTSARMEFVDSL